MGQTHAVPISFKGGCLAYLDYVTDGLKRRLNMKVGDKKFSTFLGVEVEHGFRTFGAGIGANDTAKFRFPDDEFPNTNLLIRRSHDSGLLIFIGPTYVNRRLGKCLMIPVDTYFEILNEKDIILASGRVIRIEGLIRSHETFISNGGHSQQP